MKNSLLVEAAIFVNIVFFDICHGLLGFNGLSHRHRLQDRRFLKMLLLSLSQSKSPLTHFNDFQDARIEAADQIPFDYESLLSVDDEMSSPLPQVVSYGDFQELYRYDSIEEKELFFKKFQNDGGCFLLEFDASDDEKSEEYLYIIQSMWWTMNEFYSSENYTNIPELHQQYLPRKEGTDEETDEIVGGYDFVQTYRSEDGRILPTSIQNHLGNITKSWYGVDGSFQALSSIGKMVAEILVTGALCENEYVINDVMSDIIGSFSNCNHRLCRYRPAQKNKETISLRSHTDWSLLTLTPISAIPGLMVFRESTKEWMVPDTVVSQGKEHSQYLLVMAGKNLDLLTNTNTGLACIHQVVTTTSVPKQQRLSAPFFLRPKEKISNQINDVYNSKTNQEESASQEGIISKIHSGLFQKIIEEAKERNPLSEIGFVMGKFCPF